MTWIPNDSPLRAGPRRVELDGVDGSVWPLHGEGMGRDGVFLASFKGLYHPQRTPMSQQPAFYPGAIPGDPKTDPQKVDLKLTTFAADPIAWEDVEHRWWSAVNDEEDATLRVFNRKGDKYRELPVRVEAYPDDTMDDEPDQVWDWALPMIAYAPGWRGQTIRSEFTGTAGTITLGNPGDLPVWVEFSLSNTGVEKWTVPDGIGGAQITLEQFPASLGPIVVNSDPFTLQLDSLTESQIAASLLGLRWRYPIPPNTPPTEVPISVTGGSGEAAAYVTPMYRRPWG